MNKILVIRVGRAGDMVMITPALQALLDYYPEHELHVLTSADGKRVLSGFNPRIKKLLIYEKKRLTSWVARRKQLGEIRQSDYEYIFNLELKPSYKEIYKNSSAKIYEIDLSEPNLNIARRFFNVVQRSVDHQLPNYWDWLPVSDEGIEKARQQLTDAGISESDYVIGIHPSFSGSKTGFFFSKSRSQLREWPTDYFSKLIELLESFSEDCSLNVKIIIDLLPEEREIGERVLSGSRNKAILFTLAPNFERYKALIKRMDLLITPDTGPMHIAAAMGTNIVCLFSGKSPGDCGPYMPDSNYIALQAENFSSEPGLQAIKPENVFEASKHFLPECHQ